MSKRVYDDNGTPRNLVEVPMPMNQKPRQSTQLSLYGNDNQQQPPYNNSNMNNPFGNNNNNNNNNNMNNMQQNGMQPNNEYGIVPRVGPKKKTIIIKDEKGNEISRIVSSTNSRFPESLLPQRNNNIAPLPPVSQFQLAPVNPYPPIQSSLNPYPSIQSSLNPLLLQPQYLVQNAVPPPPSAMVTPVPMLMAPPYSANPYMDKGPLITQTIPEEQMTPSARQKRTSAHYRTLEK